MMKWSLRPSMQRISRALHTPANTPGTARRSGEYINDTIDCEKQTWADTEEALADFYANLLTLQQEACALHEKMLNRSVEQVFRGYGRVLSRFACYLEATGRQS
jgi:hypothetical protein